MRFYRPVSLVVIVFAAILNVASADGAIEPPTVEWPQWRGPTRDGQYVGPAWPDKLAGDALLPLWRIELGPSYSGPIVGRDRVFVTETKDRKWEVVRALDRNTGRELWMSTWEGAIRVPFFAASNGSWIRATPAYDGECLFVAGMRDVLVCLDATSGNERWRLDFVERLTTPLPAFGCVSSPLVDGDFLYVQAGASVAKLDKRSGKIVWRTMKDDGGMMGSAFSSPIIRTVAGRRQLLAQTRNKLAGVDLDSGEVLWSTEIPAFRGMNILTPTAFGDAVFTSSYGGRSLLFRIACQGNSYRLKESWSNKSQGYMSTPVVINDHAYMHLRNQRLTCIDLKTGETRWTSTPFGKYWSMVANGDQILALDERGELLLVRATPVEFVLLDRRTIADNPTWAHLAVCGGEVFIRELDALAAYKWGLEPNSRPSGQSGHSPNRP